MPLRLGFKPVAVLTVLLSIVVLVEIFDKLPLKRFRNNIKATTNITPLYCKNIPNAIKLGRWQTKPGVTEQDRKFRASQDVLLRRHRGLPDHFLRSDLRCGTKYPIDAPAFGPQLPSMCDHGSHRHCCNATNWCSRGSSNCACSDCTDFRKIISAELNEWIPNQNCQVRNYTSEKACNLVNDKLSSLVIIGDSLMRHFYAALLMIFTNDFLEGTMIKGLTKEERINCRGERQFVDRGKAMCHTRLARSNLKVNKKKFCKGTTTFSFHFNESYAIAYREHAFNIVRENLNRSKSLFVVGVGMHDGLNAKAILDQYVEPIMKIIGNRKWPRLLWVTTHAQGYLKPMAYRGSQNNQKILLYNQQMTKLLDARGIEVFDVFNITCGVHSYDGTHYGYGINMAKAQFLLNYIDATVDP